eukprot:4527156-Alexandrium_andersonii.AAC.1
MARRSIPGALDGTVPVPKVQSAIRPRPVRAALRLNPQSAMRKNAKPLHALEAGTARAQGQPRNRSPKLAR